MEDEIKYKTKISITHLFWIILVFYFIAQYSALKDGDFLNTQAWVGCGFFLTWIMVFNLFFTWSIELHSAFLKINFAFPFRKPKIYSFEDIQSIDIPLARGKNIPCLKIKLKDQLVTHHYLLISDKSIKALESKLKDNGFMSEINRKLQARQQIQKLKTQSDSENKKQRN